ncbi:unnamed protein product [Ectocarpus sp. 12 AP-2014]
MCGGSLLLSCIPGSIEVSPRHAPFACGETIVAQSMLWRIDIETFPPAALVVERRLLLPHHLTVYQMHLYVAGCGVLLFIFVSLSQSQYDGVLFVAVLVQITPTRYVRRRCRFLFYRGAPVAVGYECTPRYDRGCARCDGCAVHKVRSSCVVL